MNTTNLFVELIIIGIGAIIWILLFIGYFIPALFAKIITINLGFYTAIPIISVIYVLGIISDRIIDKLFYILWEKKLRNKIVNHYEYYYLQNTIHIKFPDLSKSIEYIKSRIRIVRCWSVHLLLIIVSFTLYVSYNPQFCSDQKIIYIAFFDILLFFFMIIAFFTWRILTKSMLNRISSIKRKVCQK